MISIRLRLAWLEGARAGEAEPLLVTTGVPRGGEDDGTSPATARVGGEWIARTSGKPTADFLARVAAHRTRRTP